MSLDVLGRIVELVMTIPVNSRGVLVDLLEKLVGSDEKKWFGELKKFLRKEQCWVKEKFLTLLTTVEIPAFQRFVARDHFKVGISDDVEVKFYSFSKDFQNSFLDKIEEAVEVTTLVVYKLKKGLYDKEIRSELGEDKEETTLSQFWYLLKKQGHGQKGILLTNGDANIFYIRDIEGNLWAVFARWSAGFGGWSIRAHFMVCSPKWFPYYQVVSRN